MSEQERLRPEPTGRMRPGLTYNSWILLVVTVTVVILLGLIAWYGRFPTFFPITRPTDRESIHQLAGQWHDRWPQIPGTPQEYRDRGLDALMVGDGAGAVTALTRALAVDPESSDALLMLTIASLSGVDAGLSAEQRDDIRAVVSELEPEHPLLPVVAAWSASPAEALSLLGEPPDHPLGALTRLRALVAQGADASAAAEVLLDSTPGHRQGCEIAGRAQLQSARPAAALAVLESCAAAGASGGVLTRLRADALDGCGLFMEAAEAYQEAGADSHAAAIWIQEGGAPDAEIDALLEPGPPDVALHRLWWALLRGDEASILAAEEVLASSGASGLEFEIARAAAALARGNAGETLSLVDGMTAPQAHALRARAHLALGDTASASAAVDAALVLIPWQVRLQLLEVVVEGDGALRERHPIEVAAYSWSRHRDMPWSALVPTAELPVEGRELLVPQLEPLWSHQAGGGGGELVAGVLAAQAELSAGRRAEALEVLEALGEGYREAAGIQRLMVEVRRR
ncbi:MAG: tetratricopeptide (TPR) repeat protein [Myxococcota bacterium]|jgi:tetratricopeptide (TPR) repeat protein